MKTLNQLLKEYNINWISILKEYVNQYPNDQVLGEKLREEIRNYGK